MDFYPIWFVSFNAITSHGFVLTTYSTSPEPTLRFT